MEPHLTLIIHPVICTGGPDSSIGNHSYEFAFDRKRLIKFFKELITLNRSVKICYSFAPPPMSSKNRVLEDEVSIAFACLLSFAEAAVYQNVPIYLFPQDACADVETVEGERGKSLHFSDFNGIFTPKLDLQSTQEVKRKLEDVGHVSHLSYPADSKANKIDDKNLNFTGHLVIRPVSSEDIVDLLAKGSNVVVPNGSNENTLITMVPQYSMDWDDFGISWKTQNDHSYSCNQVRVPVVVQSNKIFYSNRGVDFMNVFKKELQEFCRKLLDNNKSVSSNPFHVDVNEKKSQNVPHDLNELEYQASDSFILAGSSNEHRKAPKGQIVSRKSPSAIRGDEEASNSDSDASFNAHKLTNFLNQFKEEMRKELSGIVEETVQKYVRINDTEGVTALKKEANVRSVINVSDCVKSETDDSDLPKLLSTLSQIEEQLSSIENAENADVMSAKPNKYTHSYGSHGHHRRGRDFNSLTRRATLGILKKRMKGAVIELEPDLFAISKSGFKVKMARNVSQSFRFVLFKYGKYRNSRFEVDFMPTIVPSGGLECCVKPAIKSNDRSQVDDKGLYSFYDVRFKSKERTGKYRCFLKILRNGKVCAHPLCINVRVKRFCSSSDPIDSAEEAMPGFCNASSRFRFDDNRFGAFESTSVANPDVDEGISGFQEYPSSVSSDSDDGEANRENDNDEGIDPGLQVPCSSFEKLKINENRSVCSNFDDDSDSSVSLLLDENEVREVVDKDFDTVKIPPCFIPNADISKEPVSVRVKRKFSSARRRKIEGSTAHGAESSPKIPDWWIAAAGESAGSSSSKKRTKPFSDFSIFTPYMSAPECNVHSPQPGMNSFSGSRKETKISNENSGRTAESASKCPYKALYPTLEQLCETPKKTGKNATSTKETQSPVAILPEKVFEMTSNVFKTVMNSMKPPSDVKDMIQKNVDETLWSISRSVLGGVHPYGQYPPQPPVTPPTQPPAMQTESPIVSAAGSSTDTPLNQPQYTWSTSFSPTTIPAPVNTPFSSTASVVSTPSTAFVDHNLPSVSKPIQEPLHVSRPTPQFTSVAVSCPEVVPTPNNIMPGEVLIKPVEKVSLQPRSISVATELPTVFHEVLGSPTRSTIVPVTEIPATVQTAGTIPLHTSQESRSIITATEIPVTEIPVTVRSTGNNPIQISPETPGLIAGEEYNRLEPDVRQKILQLNEMGFLNDHYNLFLIRKYPTDLNQVVESLVNYNDY